MDISLLRKSPQDRIRTGHPYGKDAGVTVDVLFLSPEDAKKVGELYDKFKAEGDDGETAIRKAYGRIAVKGWGGLTDSGKPLKLEDGNIDLMMLQSGEFKRTVIDLATSLREDAEKN